MSSWTSFTHAARAAAAAVTPAARAASSMFGIFNKEPAQLDTKTQENTDDAIIQGVVDTADEARAAAQVPTANFAAAIAAINANLALDNALNEKPSDKANAENLIIENDKLREEYDKLREESMKAFTVAQRNITKFREECVKEAINQFQKALDDYGIQVKPQISRDIMGKIAGSWSELLISSTQGDTSVYLSMKTFFFRINQAIDALLTQCIFLSTKWGVMQTTLRGTVPPPPPDFKSYPKVKVGQCWYVVGPILDFQNIEGRIFIYVKCYSTEQCTDGIYFWVYGSQSEGFNRVFFKLDPFGSIEKGFDYTQGTFVHLRLQMELCKYYQEHRIKTPEPPEPLELLDTLTKLNSFMMNMPYLQQHATYNRLHLYKIDYSFRFIIRKGFPLHLPNFTDSDWSGVVKVMCNQNNVKCDTDTDGKKKIIETLSREWESQCELYFPNDDTHQHYEFSRRRMGYVTTCPYIFCFTTCGLTQSCPMFKLFLSANSYKNTFWCQGFQNYTAMLLSVDPNRKIFSPVLHVVMGALLQKPDMELSTLRNIMLNIGIMSDAMSPVYNSATKALMTIGSGKFGETDASTSMPGVPPSRFAPNQALKSIQAQLTSYESLGLQFTPGKHRMRNDASLDAIIKENVTKKIDMVKCLAYFYIHHKQHEPTHPFIAPFVAEVIRLLKFHPAHRKNLEEKITIAYNETTSLSDKDISEVYTEAQTNAIHFINRSPEAAAAALFGYIYSTTKFEQELTDFAHLCLKKEWIMSMMDYAYNASPRVFNRENAIYNYLDKDGEFREFDPAALPAHPADHPPYVFISSFDEVRKEDTSPTNTDTTERDVTVVTFANIYRVDCGYHEVFADGSDVLKSILKSMSILYQISTTVVYTRENPSKILYAVTHRTPLLCLPDLPDALKYLIAKKIKALIIELRATPDIKNDIKSLLENFPKQIIKLQKKIVSLSSLIEKKEIEQLLEQLIQLLQQEAVAAAAAAELLTSPYTLLATYGRVTSYGALFAGKMMEYFFGGDNGYYQLPYFFRHFDKFLKVCHQYDSTVLMYLPKNTSPYDLLVPHPSVQSLLDSIKTYFKDIVFDTTTPNDAYIQTKLNESGPHIQAIFEYLIKDFMVNTKDADDKLYMDSSPSPSPSHSPSTSPENAPYLFGPLENSTDSDSTYQPSQLSQSSQSSQSSVGSSMGKGQRKRVRSTSISPGRPPRKGGALSIKNHNPTYKKKTSKPSKKSRKYIKSKRMMKSKGSKVTKPKTYKRRATGGKRKSKPNKTMRRYRRVRK